MNQESGLPEKTILAIQEVFKKQPKVQSAILYGSRAMGNYKKGSDIDLTLQGPELTLTDLLKLESEIDQLLLPYKVDLSLHHQIENPDLLDHIQRMGKIFYRRSGSSL